MSAESRSPSITKKGSSFRWWLGGLISLAALYLALKGVEFGQTLDMLAGVRLPFAVLALLVSFFTLLAKAARWVSLLSVAENRAGSSRYIDAFTSQSAGIFLNLFTPARLGDLARVYLFCARQGGSRSQALGTLAVEKLLDVVFLLASLVVWLPGMFYPDWFSQPLRAVLVMMGVISAACALYVLRPDFWPQILRHLVRSIHLKWITWLFTRIELGMTSLHIFRNPRRLVVVLVWSALIWLFGVLTNLFVFWACQQPLDIEAAVFLLAVLQIGVAAPSSPGRVGVFHYLTVLSLGVFGASQEAGLAVGILLHLLVMFPIALTGGFSMSLFTSHDWRELRREKKMSFDPSIQPQPEPNLSDGKTL